jgi:hypothetical protein
MEPAAALGFIAFRYLKLGITLASEIPMYSNYGTLQAVTSVTESDFTVTVQ